MGLFDIFYREAVCPDCRQKDAFKLLWKIKCPNPACPNFTPELVSRVGARIANRTMDRWTSKSFSGNFDPGANTVTIKYRNYLGEDGIYKADKTTLRIKGNYLTVCVMPTGKRIAFSKKFVGNLKEIENYISP